MGLFKDSDWEKPLWDKLLLFEPRVRDFIYEILEDYFTEMMIILDDCESPIEQLFGVAFLKVIEGRGLNYNPGLIVEPQAEVECYGKKYRVDFLVLVGNYLNNPEQCFKLVIECDGHDFHEKTKLQAARDKQRDRHLIGAGYHVIRFTGSEIWKDPFKCAREAADIIENNCSR